MTLHVHRLAGCSPTPLACYLKSLGVLRLVSEQKDASARGFFRDDAFHLVTTVDRAALLRFFVEEYAPTPVVTPWNGGSGFYPKDAKQGIDAIEGSTAPRLAPYRATLSVVRAVVGAREAAPKDDEKLALLGACRAALDGSALEWMNAAVALAGDADGRTGYPALLGTGGNDGRLDFANNFMQRVSALILAGAGRRTIEHALFGAPVRGLDSGAIGQFFPGGAGGANSTAGFDGGSLFDTWDFVLMLEGALVLAVAAVRRLDTGVPAQLSGPFSVRPSAAGYASAAGAEQAARGEQWMPLWSKPATLAEVRTLFVEGRMQCGDVPAERAVEAARALARLGVARGIDAFERYGYLERNGRSNFAVPLGRWVVRPQPHIDLLDEVAPWVDALRQAAGRDVAPTSLARDVHTLEHAMLDVCRDGRSGARWERLLVALGEAESGLLARRKATKDLRLSPLPRLSPGWINAIAGHESSIELRLATAIASQVTPGEGTRNRSQRLGSIRAHCLPLDPDAFAARFATISDGLAPDPRVVWRGRDLCSDLGAVVVRRLSEAAAAGLTGIGLEGRVHARLDDVDAFLAGRTDEARIARLARPLMAIDFGQTKALDRVTRGWGEGDAWLALPAYALFRAVYAASAPPRRTDIRLVRSDPAPMRRLLAGDVEGASRGALARLRAMGARPRVRILGGSKELARHIAASIAIPVSPAHVGRALDAVCKPPTTEE